MKILKLAEISGLLKRLPRAGWVMSSIDDPESVAEHSFRVAVMAMMLAPELGVDQSRAVKMALTHDLAEAKIGDVVVQRGNKILVDPDEKHAKERFAMHEIEEETQTSELVELFDEFNESKTPEAKLVKQIDRLEMLIQAYEYEMEQGLDLEEFFLGTRKEIVDEKLKVILNELDEIRNGK